MSAGVALTNEPGMGRPTWRTSRHTPGPRQPRKLPRREQRRDVVMHGIMGLDGISNLEFAHDLTDILLSSASGHNPSPEIPAQNLGQVPAQKMNGISQRSPAEQQAVRGDVRTNREPLWHVRCSTIWLAGVYDVANVRLCDCLSVRMSECANV